MVAVPFFHFSVLPSFFSSFSLTFNFIHSLSDHRKPSSSAAVRLLYAQLTPRIRDTNFLLIFREFNFSAIFSVYSNSTVLFFVLSTGRKNNNINKLRHELVSLLLLYLCLDYVHPCYTFLRVGSEGLKLQQKNPKFSSCQLFFLSFRVKKIFKLMSSHDERNFPILTKLSWSCFTSKERASLSLLNWCL